MQYYQLPKDIMVAVLDINRSNVSKTDAFSLAVGRIMAYQYPLDTTLSDADIKLVFMGDKFNKQISLINSVILLNLSKVRDYTAKWIEWRKDQIHGKINAPYAREDHECEDYFGLSKHFDKETLKLAKCESEALMRYHVKVCSLLEYFTQYEYEETEEVSAL